MEEFQKQALNLGISLDAPETVTKYIGALHSYIKHSLLLFKPTSIDMASVKAIHLEVEARMIEMTKPRRFHSNLSMENSKRKEKERIRRPSLPIRAMEQHHRALTTRRMGMMRTIAGRCIRN